MKFWQSRGKGLAIDLRYGTDPPATDDDTSFHRQGEFLGQVVSGISLNAGLFTEALPVLCPGLTSVRYNNADEMGGAAKRRQRTAGPSGNLGKEPIMGLILLVILVLLLLGGLPRWGYSRNWGYGPSGALGLVLVTVVVLVLLGYIPRGF